MGWLWEPHRPPCEPAVARHVPQALESSSPSLERRGAPQTGAIACSAAPRRRKSSRRRLSWPERNLESESGIERTGLAESSTGPKWVQSRVSSGAERLDLGDRTDCRFAWGDRSEEHTSELQSQSNLVCRL